MIKTTPSDYERPQTPLNAHYDVVVMGGGPAGSTVAALLAMNGQSVVVLERTAFPRFHIGESLIPATYWTLKRLGMLETMRHSAYPKKYSVQFFSASGSASQPFYFDEYVDHESSQTWQVVRGEFDQQLLKNTAAKGAHDRTDAQVIDCLFDNGRARGVKVKLATEETNAVREITGTVIVDATGQSTFLANRMGVKIPDDRMKKGTVWSYFKGALRDPGKDAGATLVLRTEGRNSWFWYIPLPDDIVSVGVVGSMDYMFGKDRLSPEQTFQREVERCPALQPRLAPSTRVTDFFTTRDFSYRTTQGAGDHWVMVGDAFGFIDPLYSSGVLLALKSGELGSDALIEAFETGDYSGAQLGKWQPRFAAGVEMFRKLVYAFYTPGFSFGDFLRRYPQQRGNVTDMLMGNILKPGVETLFDCMEEYLPNFWSDS